MSAANIAQSMTARLLDVLPGVAAWYQRCRFATLGEVTSRALDAAATRTPSDALIRCMAAKVRQLLGDDVADALRNRLKTDPAVLAANHHGINTHPEFAQAVYCFGLPDILAADAATRVIPVLACSSVTLRSYSFPRGLLLGRAADSTPWMRLPLFPASLSDCMAGSAPGLTLEHCRKAGQQWAKLKLASWERDVAMSILEGHVQTDNVLALPHFSDQATRINSRLWNICPGGPRLAYLDLEDVATELLIQELAGEDSLFTLVLCDDQVRRRVFHNLTGVPGCWSPGLARTGSGGEIKGGGTAFFWLADAKGRRFPLFVDESHPPCLRHADQRFALRREELSEGLLAGSLRPGLFCSYVLLSLVHGLSLYGGMYMIDYLPAMEQGVRDALHQTGHADRLLPEASASCALGSVFMPLSRCVHGSRTPAGLLEMIHRADLCRAAPPFLQSLPVNGVFSASVAAWYPECCPVASREPDWQAGAQYLREHSAGLELPD